MYTPRVVKRTNINLDMDLVQQAAQALGTRRTTDTVHEALRDVIARAQPHAPGAARLRGPDARSLDAMRRPRGRSA